MIFRFLTFDLDTERRELRERDQPVALAPKAFDVLCYLVEHRDRMVTKAELLDAFWSTQVSEAALQKTISLIRKAFAQAGVNAGVLKTHHGLGFRFVAEVTRADEPISTQDRQPVTLREQRLITALCVRVSKNTEEIGTRDFEALLDAGEEIVQRYEGSLLRITMDGFTVSFGLAAPCEDGARRAAHCAVELKALAGRPAAEAARFGIHIGSSDQTQQQDSPQWTPPGEIERTATRLAEAAAPGEIILSAAAQDQLRDEAESVAVTDGYRLVRIAHLQTGVPARPRKTPASFVGRSAELGFLNRNLELMVAGHGQTLALSGPAGIGKTRLVTEFLAGLDPAIHQVVKLQCLPALCNSPGAPIGDLCRALFRVLPEGTLHDEVDAALLRELLDDPVEGEPVLDALSDHQRRMRSSALVNRLLGAAAAQRPVVVVVEDSHWIDATSREVLEAIVRDVDSKRLLVLLTTRPTETPVVTEGVLQLSPLGHADSLDLLHHNTDDVALAASTAEKLVQRAAGNPFFIEELALAARVGGDPSTDLPDTVQAVTAVRIGALEAAQRLLIYIVAVIGPPAPSSLIEAMTGLVADDDNTNLDHLIRQGFLQVEAEGYAFRHMLIHDTAYAMVAPEERQRLHGDIARLLESEEFHGAARPETLAWHHQEAGQRDRALSYWNAASRDALQRSARHEAIAFAREGLKLIDTDTTDASKRELDLHLCLAPALAALRGYGALEVGDAYTRAQALNSDIGSLKADIRILVGLWIHTWVQGQLTDSLGFARRLSKIARKIEEPALTLQAEASMGQVLLHQGETERALTHLTAGLACIETVTPSTLPAQNAAVACAAYAAWATSLAGQRELAEAYIQRSEQLSQVFENPFAEAIHHALCSEPYMFVGDTVGCLALAERAIEISREHDFDFWLGTGLVMRGWALSQMQEFGASFSAFDEGISVFEATGARVQLANWYGLKAEAHLAADQHQAGLNAAQHALDCAHEAEDLFFTPRIHATLVQLHLRSGNGKLARDHASDATQLARSFAMSDGFLRVPSLSD